MKRIFTLVLLVWGGGILAATHASPAVFCQDTVFVHAQDDGSMLLQWRLGTTTSTASLRAATGALLQILEALNPILMFRDAEPCDLITMPFDKRLLHQTPTDGSLRIVYRVKQGETIFGIARRMFEIPVDTLLRINETTDYSLRIGQILTIGWLYPPVQNTLQEQQEAVAYLHSDDPLSSRYIITPETLDILPARVYTTQKGVAMWNKSKNDPNLFVLHRNAPVNSYIELRNPMYGRTVQAKVVGTIPPTYSEDIAVIVSQGVARSLGAIDGRFYVEMKYEVRDDR